MCKTRSMIRIFLLIVTIYSTLSTLVAQGLELKEEAFIAMKSYVTAIGIAPDIIHPEIMTSKPMSFKSIGSGIFTYVKYKEEIIYAVITARHVVNFYDSNSIKYI